ncbi:PEP-CTERM sorting domain-containing protein [Kiritimatiellaeota bacterium B1221]|nr:PEP-CTERM sorting domain-containing protein [Kiritimatiellaeota bacterium B1221]
MKPFQLQPNSMKTVLSVFLGALLCAGGVQVKAEILYFDDFDGTGDLDATTPDVVSDSLDYGTKDAVWSAGDQYSASGYMGSSPNNSQHARLSFTPVAGEIYELSTSFTGNSTWVGQMDDWISLGFFDGGSQHTRMTISSQKSAAGREVTYQADGGLESGSVATTAGARELKLVLDTTDTNWDISWYIDDVQAGSTYTYSSNPTITHVGFSRLDNARSFYDDFQLAVIPEPSSLLLTFSAGLAGLLLFRRRGA